MTAPVTAVDLVNVYSAAMVRYELRTRAGVRLPWHERPDFLPADFGELELASLRDQIRQAWPEHIADDTSPRVEPPAEPADWGWVCRADDVDRLIAFIDQQVHEAVGEIAAEALRYLHQPQRHGRPA